jgi:hypothetical protein
VTIVRKFIANGLHSRSQRPLSNPAANRLDQALAAYHESGGIYRAIGLGDGIDAQIIVASTGTLELRTGHLKEAEVPLKNSIERERSLAGNSAAVAAAMGYYGKLFSITNRNEPAISALREATDTCCALYGSGQPPGHPESDVPR